MKNVVMKKGRTLAVALGEGGGGGGIFLLLRTISYFTYEMANNQRKTARNGGFRERRHGCRCSRLVRNHNIAHFISEI